MPRRHAYVILALIVVGVAAGVFCGWVWGPAMLTIRWLGQLFLDALKMLIVPLLVAAIISGITAFGDVRKLGRLGGLTVAYYLSTVAVAVLIGLIMVNLIQPGAGLDLQAREVPSGILEKGELG